MPILVLKQVAPAAPAAGKLALYADSATGTLYQIDEFGVAKAVGAAGAAVTNTIVYLHEEHDDVDKKL